MPRAGGVGLCQSYLPRLDGLLNSKEAVFGQAITVGDRSGPSRLTPPRGQSDQSSFLGSLALAPVVTLGTHTCFVVMRSGFIGSRPLHWCPFSSFPLFTHFLPFFVSCLSLRHVLSSHSFLSLARVRALVCTRASTVHF